MQGYLVHTIVCFAPRRAGSYLVGKLTKFFGISSRADAEVSEKRFSIGAGLALGRGASSNGRCSSRQIFSESVLNSQSVTGSRTCAFLGTARWRGTWTSTCNFMSCKRNRHNVNSFTNTICTSKFLQ